METQATRIPGYVISGDNGVYAAGDLGFDFYIPFITASNLRDTIYATSKNFVAFGEITTLPTSNFNAVNPSVPALFVGGGNYTAARILRKQVYENNHKGVVIRYEGQDISSNIWEVTLFDDNSIRITNGNNPGSVYGLSSGYGIFITKIEDLCQFWDYHNKRQNV